MGYHVSIVRTGQASGGSVINENEVVSVFEGKFGFEIERNDLGKILQITKDISKEEIIFYYDHGEVWANNPGDTTIKIMLEVASALGMGARVRGDEGETYSSPTETFVHPDDLAAYPAKSKMHWKDLISWVPPILGGGVLIVAIGLLLFRRFN